MMKKGIVQNKGSMTFCNVIFPETPAGSAVRKIEGCMTIPVGKLPKKSV